MWPHERGAESAVLEVAVLSASWAIDQPALRWCLATRSIVQPAVLD